jgi:hypothetical protein
MNCMWNTETLAELTGIDFICINIYMYIFKHTYVFIYIYLYV